MNQTSYFFQKDALIALKNTIVHNVLITKPNRMNQIFPKKQKFEKFNFAFFLILLDKLVLDLGWHKFFSSAPIEIKIILSKKLMCFSIPKRI